DLGVREDLRMLLRNGTCRALGVCRHEAIRRMRAIAMGATEQRGQSPISQRYLRLDYASGTFLRGCTDAAGLRVIRIILDDTFECCGERRTGKRKFVSGADAAVSGNGNGSDGQERAVDGEQCAAGKR